MNSSLQFDDRTIFKRSAELLEAELGDELVALDVNGGQCFGFNDVATSVWRLLSTARSFAELRTALLADYEVNSDECTRDLLLLLQDLVGRGLIERQE